MADTSCDKCPCGRPLHYDNRFFQAWVERLVREGGEFVSQTFAGRTFKVSRHYLALHGLTLQECIDLGFEEAV